MKLYNVGEFSSITPFVEDKVNRFSQTDKSFLALYSFMFSERKNVMAEISDGYRIKKITYGECADKIEWLKGAVSAKLSGVEKGSIVGLYMDNGVEWIQIFWALILSGYSPLLVNARLSDELLEKTFSNYAIKAIVSNGKTFSVDTYFTADIFAYSGEEKFDSVECGKEVYFMSSGTSGNLKLCAYTAENFFYQVCDSLSIIKNCPQMKEHYNGELKNLALLPFYHVFGFIAVYLWFAFFSRTFVFLKDLNPQTLLNTVKKHKVTHIFAVPLVWDTVYKEAVKKIKARGEKTYKKYLTGMKLVKKSPILAKLVQKKFKEIRDNMFGESIRFLISGGSAVSSETLSFFNGIGYHMANGYGMTEIGITSVELSKKAKVLDLGSIGAPFGGTQYSISDSGELLVKSKTRCHKILQGETVSVTDYGEWFNTKDLAEIIDGRYFVRGRKDDLIVCHNGENINPEIVEKSLVIDGVENLCLFTDADKIPTLILSVKSHSSKDKLEKILTDAVHALVEAKVNDEIKKIVITTDKLLRDGEIKLSRAGISKRYSSGGFTLVNPEQDEFDEQDLSELEKEIAECFATALFIDVATVKPTDEFFTDLNGSSLDYFTLLGMIKEKFNVDESTLQEWSKTTVRGFAKKIKEYQ